MRPVLRHGTEKLLTRKKFYVFQITQKINKIFINSAICAGKAYMDTCSSDNGGALVYCGLQVGINIRNSENCDGEKPAVFTNIAHPRVRSFIREKTGV